MATGAELRAKLASRAGPGSTGSGADLRRRLAGRLTEEELAELEQTRVGSAEEQQVQRDQEQIAEQERVDAEAGMTLEEAIERLPTRLVKGATIGAAGIANLGADVLEAMSQGISPTIPGAALGAMVEPIRGAAESAGGFAEQIFGPPLSTGERFLENVGEETAASAAFGPMGRAAGQVGKLIPGVRRIARSAQQTLGDFLKDEALSVTGAAVGRTAAQLAETGEGGEAAAGIAGAVAPLATGKVVRGTRRLREEFRGATNREARATELAEELRVNDMSALVNRDGSITSLGRSAQEATRDIRANQDLIGELLDAAEAQGLTGEQFNIFSAADNPGVRGMFSKALGRNPEIATTVEARRDRGMQALADTLFEMGGTPGLSSQDSGLAAVEMNLRRRLSKINDEARALVPDGLDTQAGLRALSEQQNRLLNEAYLADLPVIDDLYRQASNLAEEYGAQWDPTLLKKARQTILDETDPLLKANLPASDLMDDIAAMDREGVPWRRLRAVQERVNGDIREAQRAGQGTRLLEQLRDGVVATLRELEDPGNITFSGSALSEIPGVTDILTATERAALEAARGSELAVKLGNANSYFSRHTQIYREGIAGAALTGNSSAASGAADALLGKYLHAGTKGGSVRDGKAFIATFKDNAEAMRNGNDYLVGEAYRASLQTGKDGVDRINRPKLTRWLKNHQGLISLPEFSDAKRAVTDVERLSVAAGEIGVPGVQDAITREGQALKTYLAAPSKVFNQVRRAREPVQELRRIMTRLDGDRIALLGLKRQFWDAAVSGKIGSEGAGGLNRSIPTVSAGEIEKVLADDVSNSLIHVLYGREHIENLGKIADGVRALEKAPRRIAAEGRPLPTAGEDVSRLAERSTIFSAISRTGRRVVKSAVAVSEFANSLNAADVARIIEAAIINEDIARFLLSFPTEANVKSLRRLLAANVFSLRFRVGETREFEEQDRTRRSQARAAARTEQIRLPEFDPFPQ